MWVLGWRVLLIRVSFFWVACTLIFSCPDRISAQEAVLTEKKIPIATKPKETDSSNKQTEDKAPSHTDKNPPNKNQKSDSFIPTEEISEDLSVSFPVDI